MYLKNFSLLYVEDDPDTLEIIGDLIKEKVSKLFLARNGKEGLASFKQHKPDIVLTDINMPILNGIDMSEAIKKLCPQQPVIILTAFNEVEYLKRAIDIGIDKYVAKPITNDKIFFHTLETVAAYLFTLKKLESQQKELAHLAYHDALTDLPNRILFNELMQKAMHRCDRDNKKIALLYLDLDGFKEVNDKHGHEAGDFILIHTAKKILSLLRQEDITARMGGDEFVIAIADLDDNSEIFQLLQRLIQIISQPLKFDKKNKQTDLRVSVSIGVTFYPQTKPITPGGMLRQADQAMYEAKLSEKKQFTIFDTHQQQIILRQQHNLNMFSLALENKELVFHFQPQINMKTHEIHGFEALIRWHHKSQGIQFPACFLPPILNDQLLMQQLDVYVIEAAFEQLLRWNSQGNQYSVSINISAFGFNDDILLQTLKRLFKQFPQISPQLLVVEILESSALDDYLTVQKTISVCREMGIRVALDDFGTGYSTLKNLQSLTIDILKIDQLFIKNILNDRGCFSIVEAAIGLANAFGCEVIAEGIESFEQGSLLVNLGCHLSQGYYVSKPLTANRINGWVEDWNQRAIEWNETTDYNSEKRQSIFAIIQLRQWVEFFDRYDSGSKLTDLNNSYRQFSQWLSEKKASKPDEQLIQIEKQHDALHQLAEKLTTVESKKLRETMISDIKQRHFQLLNQVYRYNNFH